MSKKIVGQISQYQKNMCLLNACRFGQFDFVEPFLNYGAEINAQTQTHQTPLMLALSNGAGSFELTKSNLAIVQLLLRSGATPSIGHPDLVEPLITALKSLPNEASPSLRLIASIHVQNYESKQLTAQISTLESQHQLTSKALKQLNTKITAPKLQTKILRKAIVHRFIECRNQLRQIYSWKSGSDNPEFFKINNQDKRTPLKSGSAKPKQTSSSSYSQH